LSPVGSWSYGRAVFVSRRVSRLISNIPRAYNE
jgi:hypothetical protein